MNSFVAASRQTPDRGRVARRLLLLAALLALAACAIAPKKPVAPPTPPASPAVVVPPKPTPPTAPVAKPKPKAAPPAPVGVPGVALLAPGNYDRDRAVILAKLAKANPDAVADEEIGYTLDILQGRLRQVAGSTARVQRQKNRVVVDLSGQVGFNDDGSQLDDIGSQVLAPIARVLADYRMTLVSVLVRGDAGATKPDEPASALVRYLIKNGVPAKRLVMLGWGSVTPGTDKAASKRVELQIEPIVKEAESAPKAR